MCGIAGVFDLTTLDRSEIGLTRLMCGMIRHRGPDGSGFFSAPGVALGMRRLSIIDVDGSDQPLYNEDNSIALVFNGEIYNYRELRDDLMRAGHRLRTDGDGETLVHLYEQHGLDLFRHLRGMYALALYDANQRRLVLAVDHIGMKPLYLLEHAGLLLFASEVKAFYADPDTPRGLNLSVLDTYLSFGYMLGEDTLFEGVRRLAPGHALVVEGGAQRLERYWAFPDFTPAAADYPADVPAGDGDVIERARAGLAEAVRLHLRSDVPLGLFLSGGIDSAAVLALMQREAAGRIKTFTVGYDMQTPDNELLHARRTAAHFETEHHERVINAADWWDGLERYIYHHDEPNANPSAVSLLLLSEIAGRQVKVVLTGLGGDELFGGYLHHRSIPQILAWGAKIDPAAVPAARLADALAWLERYYPAFKRYRVIGALPTYLPRLRHALLPPDEALLRVSSYDGMVFSDALRDRLYGADLKAAWKSARHKEGVYAGVLRQSWRDDPYNTAQAVVINTWLTGNALLSQDKTAMAHALEARVPFFDPPLLRFAASAPTALRMRANKYILREAVRPDLPEFALGRPKQPFSTPILGWFGGELAGRIQEVLLDSGALGRGLFNAGALERLVRAHFSGRENHVEVIFRLLMLELWARRFRMAETAAPAPELG